MPLCCPPNSIGQEGRELSAPNTEAWSNEQSDELLIFGAATMGRSLMFATLVALLGLCAAQDPQENLSSINPLQVGGPTPHCIGNVFFLFTYPRTNPFWPVHPNS